MPVTLNRRQFLVSSSRSLGILAGGLSAGVTSLGLSGCKGPGANRYTAADKAALTEQQVRERAMSGKGPFGVHRYKGYRGLAELPWFEIDSFGVLRMIDESVPKAIDMHCHFGMSLLFKPELDLHLRSQRVRHILDCDETDPGCDLDLDVYINANFTDPALRQLHCQTLGQVTVGSEFARTQTIPNLLAEMDAMRVERSMILPIAFNLPFGDDLAERWREAIVASDSSERLLAGASVHPRDVRKIERLEAFAAQGARVLKMHPTMQGFYPDEPDAMEIYEAAERLGMVIFFHGGRAGIEPASRQAYALPRHYEGALSAFPNLPFVLGHAGARDGDEILEIGLRYQNAWFGLHGQGITHLDKMIDRTGGKRLLFGTDWPFYHIAATLAKVLIVTDTPDRREIRNAILRGNAEQLLA